MAKKKTKKKKPYLFQQLRHRLADMGGGPMTWARIIWEYERIREKNGKEVEKYRGLYVAGSLRRTYVQRMISDAIKRDDSRAAGAGLVVFDVQRLRAPLPRAPNGSHHRRPILWEGLSQRHREIYRMQSLLNRHTKGNTHVGNQTFYRIVTGPNLMNLMGQTVWEQNPWYDINQVEGAPAFRPKMIDASLSLRILQEVDRLCYDLQAAFTGQSRVDRDRLIPSAQVGRGHPDSGQGLVDSSRELAMLLIETDAGPYAFDLLRSREQIVRLCTVPNIVLGRIPVLQIDALVSLIVSRATELGEQRLQDRVWTDALWQALEVASMRLDGQGRLHSTEGPAYRGEYYIDGVRVPAVVVEHPHTLDIDDVLSWTNLEVRRVALDRMDRGNIFRSPPVSVDKYGELYQRDVGDDRDGPLTMVRVVNSTPEPDGTYKVYWLRVPPGARTPREALAWTFDLPEQADYDPSMET